MPEKLCKIAKDESGIAILTVSGSSAATPRQFLEAIQRQIATVAGNNEITGIIITGTGDSFCRSSKAAAATPYEASALAAFGQQVMFSLEKTGKVCIAAISGECFDIGLELALSCDFIIASDSAVFGFPAISGGLIPFCGGSQRLARLVGKSKAKEMIFGGEPVNATEALRIRLVNRIYKDSELLSGAQKLLTHICRRSPNAIRVGGEVINAGYDIDLHTACMLERDAFALCFSSFDQREGMQAFLDKRQPHFKGE